MLWLCAFCEQTKIVVFACVCFRMTSHERSHCPPAPAAPAVWIPPLARKKEILASLWLITSLPTTGGLAPFVS